jgi:hypothetical protein
LVRNQAATKRQGRHHGSRSCGVTSRV